MQTHMTPEQLEEQQVPNTKCDVTGTGAGSSSSDEKAFGVSPGTTTNSSTTRRRRSLAAEPKNAEPKNAYTMKVLVGVDTKMQEYHNANGRNLKEYILTLMSIVRTTTAMIIKCEQF